MQGHQLGANTSVSDNGQGPWRVTYIWRKQGQTIRIPLELHRLGHPTLPCSEDYFYFHLASLSKEVIKKTTWRSHLANVCWHTANCQNFALVNCASHVSVKGMLPCRYSNNSKQQNHAAVSKKWTSHWMTECRLPQFTPQLYSIETWIGFHLKRPWSSL